MGGLFLSRVTSVRALAGDREQRPFVASSPRSLPGTEPWRRAETTFSRGQRRRARVHPFRPAPNSPSQGRSSRRKAKEESWNEMLSRFCEELIGTCSANKSQAAANWQEGDENIVDSLLDSFLQQKGLRSSSCEWNRAICYL